MRRAAALRLWILAAAAAAGRLAIAAPAFAADAPAPAEATAVAPPAASDAAEGEAFRRLAAAPSSSKRLLGSMALGKGLRFNNPYRLRTQLGDDAESLSLTASYLDLGIGAAIGPAEGGLQHGAALHVSIALAGVAQQVVTPSYLAAWRATPRLLATGRVGPAIVTAPDANVGGELAVGLGLFLTAGIALSAETSGSLFYGAGTRETRYAVYPILSAQLGVLVDYEVLP